MGRDGAGASTTVSHRLQLNLGRTCRTTLKLSGTYSSTSEMSSPNLCSVPPQSGQQLASGGCVLTSRGRCSGSERREGCFGSSEVGGSNDRGVASSSSASRLQFFKLQFQLSDLANEFFALRSEEHPLQLIEQQLEACNLAGTKVQGRGVLLMPSLGVSMLCPNHRLQRGHDPWSPDQAERASQAQAKYATIKLSRSAANPHEH